MARDYAQLATRISSFTTKCVLTAIVLVAGLGFGRQVLQWWSAEEVEPSVSPQAHPTDGLGDPFQMHIVQFADHPWSMRRRSITGDRQAAVAALRETCREAIGQCGLPDDEPAAGEIELLESLAAREPVEQQPGGWRMYQVDRVVPMVVGTRPNKRPKARKTEENPVATDDRLVTWGLAMPLGSDAWTVCTFQPEAVPGGGDNPHLKVPVPDGCRRIISMQVAGGGAMVGFVGSRRPKTWAAFYDDWFARRHWEPGAEWQRSGKAWYVRYVAPQTDPAASVDVHFCNDDSGRMTGLLIFTNKGTVPIFPRGK